MQSAKNILFNTELFTKKSRHPANEFQAYAYKLAHDLNDLAHLQIYMRMAKTTERSLMERAFSFVADSTSQDKGRLFLWKLKQLKKEMKFKINKENFSYEFVFGVNKDFRNDMWQEITSKKDGTKFITESLQEILNENIFNKNIRRKRKFLVYGYLHPEAIKSMITPKSEVTVYEYSKNLSGYIKNALTKIKVNRRDFIAGKQKNNSFDVIIFSNMWQLIPKEVEDIFLEKLQRLIRKDGIVIFLNKYHKENSQSYNEVIKNNLRYYYFQKKFNSKTFLESAEKYGFKVQQIKGDSNNMICLQL